MSNSRQKPKEEDGFLKSASLWINIATILIGIGVNYGIVKSEGVDMQRRVADLEKSNISQVKWQTDKNSEAIDRLATEQKATAAAIAAIQSKIDVIATKVDYIAESLKRNTTH